MKKLNAAILCACLYVAAAVQATPSNVQAFFRDGQVFITWTEDGSATYDVYRHTEAITSGTIAAATKIVTVGNQSSNTVYAIGGSIGQTHWIIQPKTSGTGLGTQLTDNQGLFVHTTKEVSGNFYYAVTSGGTTTISGNTVGPVSEQKMRIKPIPICRYENSPAVQIHYEFFMDYSIWNPDWTGYIYNFLVKLPGGWSASGDPMPIVHSIEGHTGRLPDQLPDDASPGPNIYVRSESVAKDNLEHQDWYYGHFNKTNDSIGNYTEYRIILSLLFVTRDLNGDSTKIFGYGFSMGGSGTLTLASRYPTIFSSVFCCQPATDYGNPAFTYHSNVAQSYGTLAQNLPIVNLPFNDPARPELDNLQKYNGTPVYTWQNTRAQLVLRATDEMPLICLTHGTADLAIDWATQGAPFGPVLRESRRAFKYVVNDDSHNWQGFNAINWDMQFEGEGEWNPYKFKVDESMPGFSGIGSSNSLVSAVWTVVQDQPDTWEMTISGVGEVCNVTPRRCQAFYADPGDRFDLFVNNSLQASDVTADTAGLVTGMNIDLSTSRTVKFVNTYRSNTGIQAAAQAGNTPFRIEVFPNPFNPTVTIALHGLETHGTVSVEIFNVQGGLVRQFHAGGPQHAASVTWDSMDQNGSPCASGIYVIKVRGNAGQYSKRVMLAR